MPRTGGMLTTLGVMLLIGCTGEIADFTEAEAQQAVGGAAESAGPGRGIIGRILAHGAALELTPDQVRELEDIQIRIRSQSGPLREQLRAAWAESGVARPHRQGDWRTLTREERRERVDRHREAIRAFRAAHPELDSVRQELRAHARQAREDVLAVLTDAQEAKIREWRASRARRGDGGRHRHPHKHEG